MKIATNFVHPPQRMVKPVAGAMWLAAAALAALAWWLIDDAAQVRGDLPQLRTRLERVAAEKSTIAAPLAAPPAQELAEMRDRIAKINASAQTKGLPTLALLAELEKQLPPDAWLTSVHHRAAEGEVTLVAAAAGTDSLSAFLLKLEGDPVFDEAMLMRELRPGGSGPNVQYEIRLKVRP